MKNSCVVFVMILINLNEIHSYLYPMCARNEFGCENESSKQEDFAKNATTFQCVICTILTFMRKIYNEYIPKGNIFPERTFKYKPPPSLFEKLAVWTGAKTENSEADELWEAQKIFMLASVIIFSMIFLYYGPSWFNSFRDISIPQFEKIKIRICHKCKKNLLLTPMNISPSSSFTTCCTCNFSGIRVSEDEVLP